MRSLKSLFLLLGVFVAGIAVAEEPLSPGDELAAPVEEDPLQEGIRRFQAQEIEAAETLLLAARKTRPEDAEASYYLGRVFLAQGRAKEAVESFEQAMALDPKASAYPFWLAEAIVVRIEEVSFFSKLGLARRMRAAYEKAVELDPENLEARISVARYHSEAPAIAGGSAEQAETQLAEIRRRDPALAHVAEGLIHEQLKRPEEAALAFEAAVEVDPESIVGWRELGYYYQRTDRWDDAQRAFGEVLARAPQDPAALYEAAHAALVLSERTLRRAETALETYLQLEPGQEPMILNDSEAPRRAAARERLQQIRQRLGEPEADPGE